jgi:phage shock protein C
MNSGEFISRMKGLFERQAFGVCAFFGEKLGIASSRIRLFFIYISFLTLGSPVILYFILAFWLNIKKYIRLRRHILWGQ